MNMHVPEPISCPCCRQPVHAPSLEIVADRYKITPLQSRILSAIWRGRGLPVPTERIFDVMYADDCEGAAPTEMYRSFKVALFHLRERLRNSGISIENVGYRRGYRLVLGKEIN